MGLAATFRRWLAPRGGERDALSFSDYLGYFGFGGMQYPFFPQQTISSKQEVPSGTFESYVQAIYKRNGIVFACMAARLMLFSQARFQFRRRVDGRPGELWGNKELALLEKPWTRATTGDLLARAIQHADLAGEFYAIRRGDKIRPVRPDWMTIIVGSDSYADDPNWQLDAEIVGYMYEPGGRASNQKPIVLLPEQVAHFAPIPDPSFRFRGMSWITPVINEILGDAAATEHKLRFFENGATPNMAVALDKSITPEIFKTWRELMKEKTEGKENAYRTLYLGGGATVTPLGAVMRQIDFKNVQGAGETRIAAAAQIPPIIVGLSEGLNAATYSNYAQARRAWANGGMAYLWQNMAGSLGYLVNVPDDSELWYDSRDIPFLQEDVKDAADIHQVEAQTVKIYIEAGFEPDAAIDAAVSGDMKRLKGKHTGLTSIQLQPPGSKTPPSSTTPPQLPPPTPTPALPSGSTPPVTAPSKKSEDEPVDDTKDESDVLTPRERNVANLIAAGLTNKEVAERLSLSERSVERIVSSGMRKLGVKTRNELAVVIDVRHDDGAIAKVADATSELARSTGAVAAAVAKPRITKTTVQKRDEKGRLEVAVQEET
jgi:DNA-binding NarL/FixJ family response regulator